MNAILRISEDFENYMKFNLSIIIYKICSFLDNVK